jgi:hypothetical protein
MPPVDSVSLSSFPFSSTRPGLFRYRAYAAARMFKSALMNVPFEAGDRALAHGPQHPVGKGVARIVPAAPMTARQGSHSALSEVAHRSALCAPPPLKSKRRARRTPAGGGVAAQMEDGGLAICDASGRAARADRITAPVHAVGGAPAAGVNVKNLASV